MTASRRIICFINIGHAIDHMLVMIFPTAVLGMQAAGLAAIGLLRAIYNRSRR